MRYIIENRNGQEVDEQIAKWKEEGKVVVDNEAEKIIEIQQRLQKVSNALNDLRKIGYNDYVMKVFIIHESKLSKREVEKILDAQQSFFKLIGIKIP